MGFNRHISFLILALVFVTAATAQRPLVSLATDISLQRSFKKGQQYWSVGQTVAGHIHFTPKNGAYAWLGYYTNGKVKNNLEAIAKDPATTPQVQPYLNRGKISFKQVSLGWRHYFKGNSAAEASWNLYGLAGLGLVLGRVENTHSVGIDTATYKVPVLAGQANFKRLTFDLGLGYEKPVGADTYVYVEGKVYIPSSGYPSDHLFVNKDAPLAGFFALGFRILFGN